MEILIWIGIGIFSYAIGLWVKDIIWRSRLEDNNIEFKGFDEDGYSVLIQKLCHKE